MPLSIMIMVFTMSEELKCSICGSKDVIALIEGKYYCFKCGSKIVERHVLKQLEELERRGIIALEEGEIES
ncbi:MAG: hypothetical protein DRJ49_02020 [Thermoprotei archaeon]|nr:MAG: hypothetical protein DRN53_03125 [Thermoprotei archaeon]RLE89754.1 MAG: hypothetical protein DRJ49_02020 [Thermoprotei archaeon]